MKIPRPQTPTRTQKVRKEIDIGTKEIRKTKPKKELNSSKKDFRNSYIYAQ